MTARQDAIVVAQAAGTVVIVFITAMGGEARSVGIRTGSLMRIRTV